MRQAMGRGVVKGLRLRIVRVRCVGSRRLYRIMAMAAREMAGM